MAPSDSTPPGAPSRGAPRSSGAETTLDPAEAVLRSEAVVCRQIFAGPGFEVSERAASVKREASADAAVRAAVMLASRGERASVLLAPREVLGALDALAFAAAMRSPILVHVAGKVAGAARGRDELGPLLAVGTGVLVSWCAQDAVDLTLAARRAAEDSETPFVHVHDAARVGEAAVVLHPRELVAQFLGGERRAARSLADAKADALDDVRRKRAERSYASRAPFALGSAMRELGELTGRPLGAIERHAMQDADEVIVAIGSAFVAARAAAIALRAEGKRVGVLGLRALRPFFGAEAVKASSRARAIVVMEPLDIALAPAGPVATELKAAFADALTWAPGFPGVGRIPPVVSVVLATVDGVIDERHVRDAVEEIAAGERARRLVVLGSDASS